MSNEIENDGEVSAKKIDSADGSGRPESVLAGVSRLDPFSKEAENPEECPKGFVPMFTAGDLRVSLLNGNVYNFPAGKCVFVQERDKNVCAGKGASVMDEKAMEAAAQALADAEELAQLRKEKQERLDAEAAESKAAMEAEQKKAAEADSSAKQQNDAAKANASGSKTAQSKVAGGSSADARKTTKK